MTPDKCYYIQKTDRKAPYFSLVAIRDLNNVFYQVNTFENAVYADNGNPIENLVFKRPAFPNIQEYYIESVKTVNDNSDSLIVIGRFQKPSNTQNSATIFY